MLVKIAVLAVAVFVAWRAVAKAAESLLGGSATRPKAGALEPSRCPRCGVYRLKNRPCNCADRSPS